MAATAREARAEALERWNRMMASAPGLYADDHIMGASPPSVFVGSAGYPNVLAGPMVPPRFGDTSILDSPEEWSGRSLQEIVSYRLGLVRGVKKVPVGGPSSRYVTQLQDVAMGSGPADADITFSGRITASELADGHSAPFGPVGSIRESRFSNVSPHRQIERCHYDTDMGAADAVLRLYRSGTEISRIQRCFSVGMFGRERRLVPTKWSITATDDTISKSLVGDILDYPLLDSCRVFWFAHLGNSYAVVLWPRRWAFGFAEAWYSGGRPAFGSDFEDAGGFRGYPETAGAYFAARLAVAEYLDGLRRQAAAIVLREISPDYSIPVGVWQVREGVRSALRGRPEFPDSPIQAVDAACRRLTISKKEWLGQPGVGRTVFQRSITDF